METFSLSGLGIAYLPSLHQDLIDTKENYDFIEVVPDGFIGKMGFNNLKYINEIKENFPIITHSLDLSIASAKKDIKRDYFRYINQVIVSLGAKIYSDHLAFTDTDSKILDIYLPPFYSKSNIDLLTDKLFQVKSLLNNTMLAMENVPNLILSNNPNFMSEGQFFSQLCEKSDIRIILNLDSLIMSSKVLNKNPIELLESYPLDKVVCITVVPDDCMNVMLKKMHGRNINSEMIFILKKLLPALSKKAILIQRRYSHNTYDSLKGFIDSVRELM